jgi:LacI family fructose operon transcriptional repressor
VKADNLQALADATGVSRMTVSRVLRGAPHASEATRKRVLDAKEKLGYAPNPLVSALMSSVRRGSATSPGEVIGFLTSFPSKSGWRAHPSIVRMRAGAVERAAELGYRLEDFWLLEPGQTPARLSRILYTRYVRSVLVAPAPSHGFVVDLDWLHFATATFEYSLASPNLHRACTDRFHSIRLAWREVVQRGYRRPGLALMKDEDDRNNDYWSAGALLEGLNSLVKNRVPPLLMENYNPQDFRQWMHRYKPDCVMAINHHLMEWLEADGHRVPEEVGFVHLNLTPDHFGKIAGIDGCIEMLGRSAVDIVVGQMHRNEWGLPATPRLVVTPGRWVNGPTLRG